MDSFSFDDHFIFRSKFKKPIKKNTETLLQISTFINDTDVANNIDPIEKKYHERMVICILSHHWKFIHLPPKKKILKMKIGNCTLFMKQIFL